MDIDFYTASDRINIERLAHALEFLDAKIRTSDREEGVAFDRSRLAGDRSTAVVVER
jgi:hypothetical protein